MKSLGSNKLSFKNKIFANIKWEAGPDDDLVGVIQPPGIFEVQGHALQMTEDTQGPND